MRVLEQYQELFERLRLERTQSPFYPSSSRPQYNILYTIPNIQTRFIEIQLKCIKQNRKLNLLKVPSQKSIKCNLNLPKLNTTRSCIKSLNVYCLPHTNNFSKNKQQKNMLCKQFENLTHIYPILSKKHIWKHSQLIVEFLFPGISIATTASLWQWTANSNLIRKLSVLIWTQKCTNLSN